MNDSIKIGSLHIPTRQYASQGNAILGIRDSGKTYAATMIAEQLLDRGIPFIVFDPIGVWRNLKLPGLGSGYKVVVAHPINGDLPLTPESAPEIVRAAMRENIPLVIDLYAMNLSKADWKRIVENCIRLLLYENKAHGLRHIFIEEAAEFCPQIVSSDNAKVYAEVEKLARMGGNASLGYTLINQRAEQVNKAVLELCDSLFLFRQKGKNSLTSLGKWLDFSNTSISKEVVSSLPSLPTGECWTWPQGADIPVRLKVQQKKSFHPDRQNPVTNAVVKSGANVTDFVTTLNGSLSKFIESAKENDPAVLKKRIKELERVAGVPVTPKEIVKEVPVMADDQLEELKSACDTLTKFAHELNSAVLIFNAAKMAKRAPVPERHQAQYAAPVQRHRNESGHTAGRSEALGKCDRAILTALAQYPQGRTNNQVALLSGYSVNSGGFNNSLSSLRQSGFISRGQPMEITSEGLAILGHWEPLPTGRELISYWLPKLDKCEREIVGCLAEEYGIGLVKEELGQRTGYSHNSGGFNNALSRLRTLELITRGSPIKLSEDFFQ